MKSSARMIRRIGSSGSILLGLVVATIALVALPTGPPPAPTSGGHCIRIATANLYHRNVNPNLAETLRSVDADLLLLQEWTGDNLNPAALIDVGWRVVLGEDDSSRGTHGFLVLAREGTEAVASRVIVPGLETCRIPLVSIRLSIANNHLSVLAVHAPPEHICGLDHNRVLALLSKVIEGGRLTRKLGVSVPEDPLVLAGDFNSLPWSEEMGQLLDRGLEDAVAMKRWRKPATYRLRPWLPPLIRIDYVLVSDGIIVRGAWTVDLPGSDHRLVIVELGAG